MIKEIFYGVPGNSLDPEIDADDYRIWAKAKIEEKYPDHEVIVDDSDGHSTSDCENEYKILYFLRRLVESYDG